MTLILKAKIYFRNKNVNKKINLKHFSLFFTLNKNMSMSKFKKIGINPSLS